MMGQKLLSIYEEINKVDGLRAKMRLATMTGIPSVNAGKEPDSPENLKKFAVAYKEITSKDCPIK
jgi:hypothetical protein